MQWNGNFATVYLFNPTSSLSVPIIPISWYTYQRLCVCASILLGFFIQMLFSNWWNFNESYSLQFRMLNSNCIAFSRIIIYVEVNSLNFHSMSVFNLCLLLQLIVHPSEGMERDELELPTWEKEQRRGRPCMCHSRSKLISHGSFLHIQLICILGFLI